jgi:hypothetical protein
MPAASVNPAIPLLVKVVDEPRAINASLVALPPPLLAERVTVPDPKLPETYRTPSPPCHKQVVEVLVVKVVSIANMLISLT